MPHSPSLQRQQIAEVQLLRSSVLPDEFQWRGTREEVEQWEQALASFHSGDENGGGTRSSLALPPFSAAMRLRGEAPTIWLDLDLPTSPDKEASIALRMGAQGGDRLREDQLAALRDEVATRWQESKRDAPEYPLFDLYTSLQDYLLSHSLDLVARASGTAATPSPAQSPPPTATITLSRLIIWSHHLLSQIKRRQISSWCTSLSVWALLKTGYPGYLCFEGLREDVKEIEANVKGMQWAAILVRDHQSWVYTGQDGEEGALLTCPLAKQFSGYSPAVKARQKGEKVRTTCEEIETMKDIVDRLRSAGLPEEEVVDALGLRTKQNYIIS